LRVGLESTRLMLNSATPEFPNGLGNGQRRLGHNLMDHSHGERRCRRDAGHEDKMPFGNRPNGIYVPRFRNTNEKNEAEKLCARIRLSGRGQQRRMGPRRVHERIRRGLQENAENAGAVADDTAGFGECLPYHSNCVELNKENPTRGGFRR